MKIKDLDEEMLDYYCANHVCEKCPLNRISFSNYCLCVNLLDFSKEHEDVLTEISILSKEEWLYLKAVIEPFKDRVTGIKVSDDTIYFAINGRWAYNLIKCFEFKGLTNDKGYTLEELDL